MTNRRRLLAGLCACAAIALAAGIPNPPALGAQRRAPRYELDSSWPKPLPERWIVAGLGGVCVDNQDHVFLLHRQDVLDADLNAGQPAPLVIEIDPSGTVVNSWGDPALLDPRLHSCHFDGDDDMWIASAPSGMVQKYSHDGRRLLQQIGNKGVLDSSDGSPTGKPLNSNAAKFFMPSSLYVDRTNGDLYVSDGESAGGNRRVAVMDRNGAFLRQWRPEMETVHCLTVARDGLVYVCNRLAGRIQVYDKAGAFVRAIDVPWTPSTPVPPGKTREQGGSVVSIELSRDASQSLMFVINQNSAAIEVRDRTSGALLSTIGNGSGHFPGQFDQAHGLAVDSQGNVYVAENRGKRVQKFRPVP